MINSEWVRFLNTNGVFVLVGTAMIYLWVVEKERGIALKVMMSVVVAGVLAVVLKELFMLPRPFAIEEKSAMAGLTALSGFPSFHSALAFSAATTVTLRKKNFGIILMILAGLVCVGRVMANVHYPVDVLAGVIIGVMVASLVYNTPMNLGRRKRS